MQIIAKVFKSGNSQAIRIPKEYRLDTDEVSIEKKNDTLIITPLKVDSRSGWSNKFCKYENNMLIDDALDIKDWDNL